MISTVLFSVVITIPLFRQAPYYPFVVPPFRRSGAVVPPVPGSYGEYDFIDNLFLPVRCSNSWRLRRKDYAVRRILLTVAPPES